MMNSQLINTLLGFDASSSTQLSFIQIVIFFGHSLFLGSILSLLTYFTMIPMIQNKIKDGESGKNFQKKVILGSSNILFLCVGLTGVMILVNNNLARALSIGATMALIRFRVKLGNKNLGSNLLFGIIAGVACGLQELKVAWMVTGLYFILQGALYFILREKKILTANENQ